ncbi:MAG: response regulator [Chloroflexaceae bacterium]|nr:response regulator [Chloroflexaceae bacterium]
MAEDDADLQVIARLALEADGHTLTIAGDGIAALELARRESFDAILLDVLMPRLDGFRVCARLKEDPQTRAIPVIFLSAKAQLDDVERGLALGARGYIAKPFDVVTLSQQIQALLHVPMVV